MLTIVCLFMLRGDKEPVAAIYAIGSDDVDIPCLPRSYSEPARDFVQQCLVRYVDRVLLQSFRPPIHG